MVAELRAVFAEYQQNGRLVTPLNSDLDLGHLRAGYVEIAKRLLLDENYSFGPNCPRLNEIGYKASIFNSGI